MAYGCSCFFTSGVFGNMPEIRHISKFARNRALLLICRKSGILPILPEIGHLADFALTSIFSMFRLPHTCVQVCICGHPLHSYSPSRPFRWWYYLCVCMQPSVHMVWLVGTHRRELPYVIYALMPMCVGAGSWLIYFMICWYSEVSYCMK
jgi:hypothetical protein